MILVKKWIFSHFLFVGKNDVKIIFGGGGLCDREE